MPGNTKTHVWHAMTPLLARTIYGMAEATKHFCMDTMEKRNQKVRRAFDPREGSFPRLLFLGGFPRPSPAGVSHCQSANRRPGSLAVRFSESQGERRDLLRAVCVATSSSFIQILPGGGPSSFVSFERHRKEPSISLSMGHTFLPFGIGACGFLERTLLAAAAEEE